MRDHAKDKLKRFGIFARFEQTFFATLGDAVHCYRDKYRIEKD